MLRRPEPSRPECWAEADPETPARSPRMVSHLEPSLPEHPKTEYEALAYSPNVWRLEHQEAAEPVHLPPFSILATSENQQGADPEASVHSPSVLRCPDPPRPGGRDEADPESLAHLHLLSHPKPFHPEHPDETDLEAPAHPPYSLCHPGPRPDHRREAGHEPPVVSRHVLCHPGPLHSLRVLCHPGPRPGRRDGAGDKALADPPRVLRRWEPSYPDYEDEADPEALADSPHVQPLPEPSRSGHREEADLETPSHYPHVVRHRVLFRPGWNEADPEAPHRPIPACPFEKAEALKVRGNFTSPS